MENLRKTNKRNKNRYTINMRIRRKKKRKSLHRRQNKTRHRKVGGKPIREMMGGKSVSEMSDSERTKLSESILKLYDTPESKSIQSKIEKKEDFNIANLHKDQLTQMTEYATQHINISASNKQPDHTTLLEIQTDDDKLLANTTSGSISLKEILNYAININLYDLNNPNNEKECTTKLQEAQKMWNAICQIKRDNANASLNDRIINAHCIVGIIFSICMNLKNGFKLKTLSQQYGELLNKIKDEIEKILKGPINHDTIHQINIDKYVTTFLNNDDNPPVLKLHIKLIQKVLKAFENKTDIDIEKYFDEDITKLLQEIGSRSSTEYAKYFQIMEKSNDSVTLTIDYDPKKKNFTKLNDFNSLKLPFQIFKILINYMSKLFDNRTNETDKKIGSKLQRNSSGDNSKGEIDTDILYREKIINDHHQHIEEKYSISNPAISEFNQSKATTISDVSYYTTDDDSIVLKANNEIFKIQTKS